VTRRSSRRPSRVILYVLSAIAALSLILGLVGPLLVRDPGRATPTPLPTLTLSPTRPQPTVTPTLPEPPTASVTRAADPPPTSTPTRSAQ
jgi:hypothetical protein